MYRDGKIHLTNKGNDILVRWIHYNINGNPQPHLVPPSLPSVASNFSATADDWPPLPPPSPKPTPLQAKSPMIHSRPLPTPPTSKPNHIQTSSKSSLPKPIPQHTPKPNLPPPIPKVPISTNSNCHCIRSHKPIIS